MNCKYKSKCPSYSGWCEGPKQDFSRCVELLIIAYEGTRKKLAEYEDLDLTPEQLRQIDHLYQQKCEELDKLKKEVFGYTE